MDKNLINILDKKIRIYMYYVIVGVRVRRI